MDKKFLLIITGLTLLVILTGTVFTSKFPAKTSKTGEILSYKEQDGEKPKLVTSEKFKDIGRMKVSEEKTTTFTIENQGQKLLQIFYGSTSCDCTSGQIRINGKKSPVFSMHSNNNFYLELAPGEKGEVDLIYKPYIMPVSGQVQRLVRLKTNDPKNPQVDFVVNVFVE